MRLQTLILAITTALVLGGCTTFSLSRQETLIQHNDTSAVGLFRRGAEEFQQQFSNAGWLREEERTSRTRAFLSIINKGWTKVTDGDDSDTQSDQPKDAAARYLARHTADGDDNPEAVISLILNDLKTAHSAMVRLNTLAEPLFASQAHTSTDDLRTDVMILERALLSARKAQSLFEEAAKRLDAPAQAQSLEKLGEHLTINAEEIGRMKKMADALNTMRLSAGPVS